MEEVETVVLLLEEADQKEAIPYLAPLHPQVAVLVGGVAVQALQAALVVLVVAVVRKQRAGLATLHPFRHHKVILAARQLALALQITALAVVAVLMPLEGMEIPQLAVMVEMAPHHLFLAHP